MYPLGSSCRREERLHAVEAPERGCNHLGVIERKRLGKLVTEEPSGLARVVTWNYKGLFETHVREVRRRDGPTAGIAVGIREGADRYERSLPDESALLGEFTTSSCHRALALIDETAGDRPLVFEWLLSPAHEQDLARVSRAAEHDRVARQSWSWVVIGILHDLSVAFCPRTRANEMAVI